MPKQAQEVVELFLHTWTETAGEELPDKERVRRYKVLCIVATLLDGLGHAVSPINAGTLLSAAQRTSEFSDILQGQLPNAGQSTKTYNWKSTTYTHLRLLETPKINAGPAIAAFAEAMGKEGGWTGKITPAEFDALYEAGKLLLPAPAAPRKRVKVEEASESIQPLTPYGLNMMPSASMMATPASMMAPSMGMGMPSSVPTPFPFPNVALTGGGAHAAPRQLLLAAHPQLDAPPTPQGLRKVLTMVDGVGEGFVSPLSTILADPSSSPAQVVGLLQDLQQALLGIHSEVQDQLAATASAASPDCKGPFYNTQEDRATLYCRGGADTKVTSHVRDRDGDGGAGGARLLVALDATQASSRARELHDVLPKTARHGPFELRHKVAGAESTGFAEVSDTKHGWCKVVIHLVPPKPTTPRRAAPADGFPPADEAATPPMPAAG